MSTTLRRTTRRSDLHGMTAEQNVRYVALVVLRTLRMGRLHYRRISEDAVRDGLPTMSVLAAGQARGFNLAAKDVRTALHEEVL